MMLYYSLIDTESSAELTSGETVHNDCNELGEILMLQVIEAIYENGVLRPLEPLKGFPEHSKLKITIEAEN